MPKPSQSEIFNEMVTEGFKGIKKVIEFEELEEQLTADDIHKVTVVIEQHCNSLVEFLRMAKKPATTKTNDNG